MAEAPVGYTGTFSMLSRSVKRVHTPIFNFLLIFFRPFFILTELRGSQSRTLLQPAKNGSSTRSVADQLSDVSIFKSCVGKLATKVDEWSKITTDPWILESVRAYHLEFKAKPIQISPPLQPSRSESECKLIQREIDSLLLKGAITVAQHSKDEFLSNIFLYLKRLAILDLLST